MTVLLFSFGREALEKEGLKERKSLKKKVLEREGLLVSIVPTDKLLKSHTQKNFQNVFKYLANVTKAGRRTLTEFERWVHGNPDKNYHQKPLEMDTHAS